MHPTLASHLGSPSQSAVTDPVFVVGAVRSGTTLLRLMLDHHPRIALHFEFEFAVEMISATGKLPALEDFHRHLQQDRIFRLSGATIDPELDYLALVNSFLQQKRQRDGKVLVGATVHRQFDRLPRLWPHARYLHLLRDGRDAGRSSMAMGWAGNMYHGVSRWMQAEAEWDAMRKNIPSDRRLEVVYEQLIEDPRRVLTEICHFLGEEFDEAMFRYAETSSYGLPDPRLTQQWKRKLSDDQIQLAEARIGDMLVERGYELSGLPRKTLSARDLARLKRQDWYRRARFRMQRYGLPLFTLDYLARHLRLGPLARACRQRIQNIDNSHLD
jgi:hypothetical protein